MKFLEHVNENLNQAVLIAAKDYKTINTVLKQYYEITEDQGDFVQSEIASKVEAIITGLQYMDIFQQRVEHLVSTHSLLIPENLNPDFKKSLFHLHVFQALTIELDLLESISTVKALFAEVRDHFIKLQLPQGIETELFSNTIGIKETFKQTIVELSEAGGDTKHLPIPTLTAEQIGVLNNLYTMESERMVLEWFLNSMPHGTWQELMQRYQESISQGVLDEIELF